MNRGFFLAGLLSLTAALQACMSDAPKMPPIRSAPASTALTADASLTSIRQQCVGNTMILASVGGAHFTWGANKGTNPTATVEIPVIGSTGLAGCVFPKYVGAKQTLAGATAKLDFKTRETESFNTVRDNRIIQYIFGDDIKEDPEGPANNTASTAILRFNVDSITGDSLEVPSVDGTSISVKVSGTLLIAGFQVPLEVSVALTKTDKGFNAMNNAPFAVNIRGSTPAKNTLGLDKRVADILALVAPGTLQDMIDLNFSVDFVDLCK